MTTESKVYDTSMFKTRDYSQFKKLEYNRTVDDSRVEKLMVSIKSNGFLMPILVSENMEVADGQHRLRAAEKLGVEVTYIKYNISDDDLPILVSKLNSTSKNWIPYDYYDMWRKREKCVYIWMGEVIEKFNIDFTEFYSFMNTGMRSGTFADKFKDGTLELTETQRNKITADIIKFNNFINFSENFREFGLNFRRAISEIVRNPEYDEDRMIRKLKQDAGRLLNCVNKIDFILQVEKVYNVGEKNQIDFIRTKTTGLSNSAKKKAKNKKG